MTRYEAFTHKTWRKQGPVSVIVARIRDGGRVEIGYFVVDQFCLGVKDVIFNDDGSEADLRTLINEDLPQDVREAIHPACAKKFIEGAIAYAEQLGFAPAKEYRKGRRVLSGIDASACPETFTFGQDGKPLYIETEFDPPERTERVLAQLEARCGPDGYEADFLDDDDDEEAFDDDAGEDESFETAREGLMVYFSAGKGDFSFYEFSGMVVGMLTSPECPSMSEFLGWTAAPERRQPKDLVETQIYFDHARNYWNSCLPKIAACHDGPLAALESPIDVRPSDIPPADEDEAVRLTLGLTILWCRGFMATTRLWPECWGDVLARPGLKPHWEVIKAFAEIGKPGNLQFIEAMGKDSTPEAPLLQTAVRAIIRASPRRPLYHP